MTNPDPRTTDSQRRTPPRWTPTAGGRRVLIEHASAEVRDALTQELHERGFDTLSCAGPGEQGRCPLLDQTVCPAVGGADAVVSGLADTGPGRVIACTIHYQYPDRPLLIEGTREMLRGLEPALREHGVYPLEAQDVADRIEEQLDD